MKTYNPWDSRVTGVFPNQRTTVERYKIAFTTKDVNVLRQLAKDDDNNVRCFVALNISTPVNVLRQLAKDKSAKVRQSVATNQKTPSAIIEQLVADRDDTVRKSVIYNPNMSVHSDAFHQLMFDQNQEIKIAAVQRWQMEIAVQLKSFCSRR